MNPPRTSPGASVDLTRLRIPRGADERVRARGLSPLWLIALLAVGGGAYLFRDALAARWGAVRAGSEASVRTAEATRVVPAEAAGAVDGTGYVVADRSASLASVISGRLVELNAKEGDVVEEGSVVARVQFDDLEAAAAEAGARTKAVKAQVEQARLAVAAAELDVPRVNAERTTLDRLVDEARENAERLAREVERNRPLVPRVVPADVFDRLEAQHRASQRALEAAEARVAANQAALTAWSGEIERRRAEHAVAEANLEAARRAEVSAGILVEKTKIRAPFRGRVIRKDAEQGEVIAPTGGGANSKGSVLTIIDPESLEMQVELNEKRIGRVNEGDAAVVRLDADPVAGRTWPAKVRKIWPRADRSKGTVEVRVAFEQRPPFALPDMVGNVKFTGTSAAAAAEPPYVVVPAAAVVKRDGRDAVFVVLAGTARLVNVRLGAAKGDAVVVAEGLTGGETVILAPSAALVSGERVAAAR